MTDETKERAAQESLGTFLRTQNAGEAYIEYQVAHLFDDENFRPRFTYFMEFFDDAAKKHLLISGAAMGTEMKMALEYGFERVTGTEVLPELVDICNKRFTGSLISKAVFYDGEKLPFPDETFSSAISGHIIEHTRSPRVYLLEHIRVLQPGAYMFLEFPSRYHWKELHTNLPSLEWLPKFLRKIIIRVIVSQWSPLAAETKQRYRQILETLQPVSRLQIWWWLRRSSSHPRIAHYMAPSPGIMRLIIRKPGP